jgi:AcrR family transcriptional regulator
MTERLNRQEKKNQTRERLLDAAAEVFAKRGFETATLDEVAAAAGYTKGAVYSNFTNKVELLVALIERRVEVQSAQYSQRFEGQDIDSLARVLLEPANCIDDAEKQFLMLYAEFWLHSMRDDRTRALMAEQYEVARTFVAGMLTASGYGKPGREQKLGARDMAIVIEALGTGIALQAAIDPDGVRLGLVADVLGELLGLPSETVPHSAEAGHSAGQPGS